MKKFRFMEPVKLTKKDKAQYAVVIPTYNEEKDIAYMIDLVRQYSDNVLVIGAKKCKDKTPQIVKSLGVPYIIDNGKGKGAALRKAIKVCKTPIAVFIDADGSHNPADIPRLVKPILDNRYDMVIGSRMTGGSDELHGTGGEFMRLMFSSIITLIINSRFNKNITDYQDGYRAVRVSRARKWGLRENITTIEQEMGIKCLKKKHRLGEVPCHEYAGGASSFSVWKVGPRYFWQILRDIW